MPPRIPSLTASCRIAPTARNAWPALILSQIQARNASILATLSDNVGAYNKRIRRGRGPSSGKGKTSGRGQKGQKAHGKVPARFQGGQTPQEIVHGTRGFENPFSVDMSPINLDRIQSWIDQGRLDPTKPITLRELAKSRCLHGIKDGVKLLARGKGELKTPINIVVSRASAAAIEAIEGIGGTVIARYYTKHSIKRLLKGESENTFTPLVMTPTSSGESPILNTLASASPFSYRLPDPTSRKDLEYYRDSAHRGYLSHLVEDGHGPSLFFKTPGTGTRRKVKKPGVAAAAGENKLW